MISASPPTPGEGVVRTTLAAATRRFADAGDTPRLDAELLMAHALGTSRESMLMTRLDAATPPAFAALLARRLGGEPVAYITGVRDFWTLSLAVTPAVLIPRPDSETLIEAAIARRGACPPARILDLGTGSGALLLAALDHWRSATGLGIDISPAALDVARANAATTGMADRATFRLGDWTEGLSERFDLVLCNPPYVEASAILPRDVVAHEPRGALFAGTDGQDCHRLLAPRLAGVMAPGATACIEIGSGQGGSAAALFEAEGFEVAVRRDAAGHPRCLVFGALI